MIFTDSCGHYSIDQIEKKWFTAERISFTSGRKGKGLSGGTFSTLNVDLYQALTQVYVGLAWKSTAFANSPIKLQNPTTGQWAALTHLGSGFFQIATRDSKEAPINNFTVKQDIWFFLEIYFGFSATALTYEFRVNEENIDSGVIVGLSALPTATVTLFEFIFPGAGLRAALADIYISDSGFLGDCEIKPLFVNAAGNWGDFDGTYENVDDIFPDDEGTILETNTATEKHSVRYEPLSTSFEGSIPLVNLLGCLDLSGSADFIWSYEGDLAPVIGGGIIDKPDYRYQFDSFLLNLDGDSWVTEEVNTLDCGMRYNA